MVKIPEHHVLNFFYDNDNGSALTVWIKGTRFHIIADPSRIQDRSKRGKQIWRSYARLFEQVKAADQDDGQDGHETAPLFVQDEEDEESADSEDTKDSGIDVSEDDEHEHEGTPTEALQRWMLKPLVSSFPFKEPEKPSVEDWYHCPTRYCNLYVKGGRLQTEEEDSPSSAYEKRLDDLIPTMTLPKYINDLKIPLFSAQGVTVLATSVDPAPLHPTRVQVDGKELFLKTVGSSSFQPMVKRELQVMKRIEAEGLHNEIRVPLLRGLVHFGPPRGEPKGKQQVMGFVIDPISDPTPLTHMLDKEIPEEKRVKWADEAAKMVDLLHQHNIIWGDSKGDNFMVDANDDLWIIDFGGSYTEGWVDPELKETEEGDDQGIMKLRNGLHDPEKYTLDGDEEVETEQGEGGENEETEEEKSPGNKRKRGESEEDQEDKRASKHSKQSESKQEATQRDSGNDQRGASKRKHTEEEDEDQSKPPTKAAKQDQKSNDSQEKYCYCKGPDSGRMLACDNKNCKRQWFHFDCIGIVTAPSTKTWYCDECKPTHYPRRSEETCYGTWDMPQDE